MDSRRIAFLIHIMISVSVQWVSSAPNFFESKACYGTSGLGCTKHQLTCPGQTLCITDAYYMSPTASCRVVGLSSCPNGFKQITSHGPTLNFTSQELYLLVNSCSRRRNCQYQAPRQPRFTLSVVRYTCVDAFVSVCEEILPQTTTRLSRVVTSSISTYSTIHNTATRLSRVVTSSISTYSTIHNTGTISSILASLSTEPTSTSAAPETGARRVSSTGAVVGGVLGGACALAFVILVFVFCRRRNIKSHLYSERNDTETDLASDMSTVYHEIIPVRSQGRLILMSTTSSGNTHQGAEGECSYTRDPEYNTLDSSNVYFTLLPDASTASAVNAKPGTEGCYNHTGHHKTVTGSHTTESDNTYFTLQPDPNSPISANAQPGTEDVYNHAGDHKPVTGSQYDTMESVCRSLKLQERSNNNEGDYDHLHPPSCKTLSSSDYYTASFTENGSDTARGDDSEYNRLGETFTANTLDNDYDTSDVLNGDQ